MYVITLPQVEPMQQDLAILITETLDFQICVKLWLSESGIHFLPYTTRKEKTLKVNFWDQQLTACTQNHCQILSTVRHTFLLSQCCISLSPFEALSPMLIFPSPPTYVCVMAHSSHIVAVVLQEHKEHGEEEEATFGTEASHLNLQHLTSHICCEMHLIISSIAGKGATITWLSLPDG